MDSTVTLSSFSWVPPPVDQETEDGEKSESILDKTFELGMSVFCCILTLHCLCIAGAHCYGVRRCEEFSHSSVLSAWLAWKEN